jgi:hypothetical protein
MQEIELWFAIDSDGEYVVGKDRDEAHERYCESFNDSQVRMYCLTAKVPLPDVVKLTAELPSPAEDEVELTVSTAS